MATKYENILLNLVAAVVGIATGLLGVGFRYLIDVVQNLFLFGEFSLLESNPTYHTLGWWILLVPAVGGLLVGLLTNLLAPEAKGHGVPEVMEAAAHRGGKMRGRIVPVKALATALCIGSGGSTGREGPIVQIGAAAGSYAAQLLGMRSELVKIILACGAAGGIAASFNTPIAGVLFALELILLEFKTRSFIPLVIAAVSATVISRALIGDHPAFVVPEYTLVTNYELLAYLVLGLLSGLAAILFIVTSSRVERFFAKLKTPAYIKPVIGGLIMGVLGLCMPRLLGGGYGSINDVLFGELPALLCLLLVVGKILAVSVTLGSGGSGGIFAPSLFIGAMLGGAVGALVETMFPGATAGPGAYALVGMAAVFSGVSRATLTAMIILFEMTLNYNIIIPLMFACVVADGVAWSLYTDSIYTKKLRDRGVRFFQDLGPDLLSMRLVKEVMTEGVITANDAQPLKEVWNTILETGHQGIPVVNADDKLVGILTASDIRRALMDGKIDHQAGDYMTENPVVSYPDEDLQTLQAKLITRKLGHIPVVDRHQPDKLLGIITRSDLMKVALGSLA